MRCTKCDYNTFDHYKFCPSCGSKFKYGANDGGKMCVYNKINYFETQSNTAAVVNSEVTLDKARDVEMNNDFVFETSNENTIDVVGDVVLVENSIMIVNETLLSAQVIDNSNADITMDDDFDIDLTIPDDAIKTHENLTVSDVEKNNTDIIEEAYIGIVEDVSIEYESIETDGEIEIDGELETLIEEDVVDVTEDSLFTLPLQIQNVEIQPTVATTTDMNKSSLESTAKFYTAHINKNEVTAASGTNEDGGLTVKFNMDTFISNTDIDVAVLTDGVSTINSKLELDFSDLGEEPTTGYDINATDIIISDDEDDVVFTDIRLDISMLDK